MREDVWHAIRRLAEMVATGEPKMTIDDVSHLADEIEGLIEDFVKDRRTNTNE